MQKTPLSSIAYGFLGAAIFSLLTHAGPAIAQVAKNLVQLQPSTPGSAQAGNINVSGRVIAGQVQGDGASVTNLNANSLTNGTVADSRLSTNVMTLSGLQTVTGAKTFSTPPSFTGATPFSVTSSAVVTNLNADRLDGQSASNFLQSNPPITISGSSATPIFKATQATSGGTGLYGRSSSAGVGVEAVSSGAGGIALRARGNSEAWAAQFEGSVFLEGQNDYLMKRYSSNGTYSSTIPIAYGIINSDGTIRTGTDNFSVFKIAPAVARIRIDGMSNVSGVVTSVTPVGNVATNPRFCFANVDPATNEIEVSTLDINGTQAATNFTFIVYKLVP